MAWGQMVDMRRTPAEKVEEVSETMAASVPGTDMVADYPYGLCISLSEEELEKLGLSDDCDIGDAIDIRCFAEVTSVSKHKYGDKDCCRVELQITRMQMTEEPGE